MQHVRVIVRHNPADPVDDLRWAARIRRDLWAHSPVVVDPDSPVHGTHRDTSRNAYFELVTDRLSEVHRVLNEYGYSDRVTLEVGVDAAGTQCVDCGNISTELFTVCPTCKTRDIDPCPYCNQEIPRLAYISVAGELFKCPACHHRVRLRFNEPMFDGKGHYNQPLVCVSPAEALT